MCDTDYGCSGKHGALWWIIMAVFWLAFVEVAGATSWLIYRGLRNTPEEGYISATRNAPESARRPVPMAIANILFLNLPFLVVRLICSQRYGVICVDTAIEELLRDHD